MIEYTVVEVVALLRLSPVHTVVLPERLGLSHVHEAEVQLRDRQGVPLGEGHGRGRRRPAAGRGWGRGRRRRARLKLPEHAREVLRGVQAAVLQAARLIQ